MDYPSFHDDANDMVSRGYAASRRHKKRLGMRAGLQFFHRNNTGGCQIISRHWPHLLCWSWTLGWHPYRSENDGRRHFGFGFSKKYRHAYLSVWLGMFRFVWQDNDWMLKDQGMMSIRLDR